MYSSYQNNSALTGGIYYIYASSSTKSVVTLNECKYKYNFGGNGGIVAIYNYYKLEITSCSFEYNSAYYGGVLYTQEFTTT